MYAASHEEDYSTRVVIGGEAVDLIDAVRPAGDIVDAIVGEAEALLAGAGGMLRR